jgi:hypothetical protein
MGTALSPITTVFESHQVRLLIKDGVPYWVGKDACEGVGISAYRDALRSRSAPTRSVRESPACRARRAYHRDRKPFPFRSGIWLPGDYGTTTRSMTISVMTP